MLDEAKILAAIQGAKVSIAAKEEGAGLVDTWIRECAELDARDRTLAVEAGFYIELDPLTFVTGTEDRVIERYSDGKVCGCEWKTAKHQTRFWNAEVWFDSISKSHQLATYAAGLQFGFFPFHRDLPLHQPGSEVEILVRAVSKSTPPVIWPTPEGQFVKVTNERLEALFGAYKNTAVSIRAMRHSESIPWQVPGLQCTNMFRKECPFLESCRKGESLRFEKHLSTLHQSFSPGSQAIVKYLVESGKVNEGNFREVVILSSSSLSDYQQCPEKWRRVEGVKEEDAEGNEQMDVGTVLHAGVAELYRQMMEEDV